MSQASVLTAADASAAARVVQADLDFICEAAGPEFERMAGRSVLVVGGAGFLGYYLVQALTHWNDRATADRTIDVTVFDNWIRGLPPWLDGLAGNGRVRLVQHDITMPVPADTGAVDYIFHAASIASPTFYRNYPIETMDANVQGLRNLLEYARSAASSPRPVQGMVFFSSSEIYGDPDPDHIPTAETYRGNVSCTGPRACYDESKRFGETLCVNFARQHGLPVQMVRPFNNYGPGLKISDRRVLPDLVRDVLAGRDIVLLSDGSQSRTFCYVADAVAGYFKALINGRPGEPYNVGIESPEITIGDLASRVARLSSEIFGYRGQVVRKVSTDSDYLVDNPERRCPNIDKARAELGFNPQIGLDEGLRRALIWYGGNRQAEDR